MADYTEIRLNPEGVRVARDYARWHLGDPAWATAIFDAYNHPEETREALKQEGAYRHEDI